MDLFITDDTDDKGIKLQQVKKGRKKVNIASKWPKNYP